MREIEFRGLDTLNKQWRFGLYHYNRNGNEHMIIPPIGYSGKWFIVPYSLGQINPNTIGQFTGLYDTLGVKIFEGDIVTDKHGNKHTVFFTNGTFVAQYNNAILYLGQMYDHTKYLPYGINIDDKIDVTVIGNIHQNPELLAQ